MKKKLLIFSIAAALFMVSCSALGDFEPLEGSWLYSENNDYISYNLHMDQTYEKVEVINDVNSSIVKTTKGTWDKNENHITFMPSQVKKDSGDWQDYVGIPKEKYLYKLNGSNLKIGVYNFYLQR